jgi:hypothetical protein
MAFETDLFIGLFPAPPAGVPTIEGAIETPLLSSGGIIKRAEDLEITLNWYLQGSYLDPAQPAVLNETDNWVVNFYLEGMGGAPAGSTDEHDFGPILKAVSTKTVSDVTIKKGSVDNTDPANPIPAKDETIPKWAFTAEHTVPANTLNARVYKLTAAITFQDAAGVKKAMAGFSEGGMVQVYEAT